VGDRITYVGLDVHKEGIVVAVAEDGLRGDVRDYGRVAKDAFSDGCGADDGVELHRSAL